LKKLLNQLNNPISIFGRSDTRQLKLLSRSLTTRLINHLREIAPFMEKRSLIEYVFKTAKNAFSLKKKSIDTLRDLWQKRFFECTFTRAR